MGQGSLLSYCSERLLLLFGTECWLNEGFGVRIASRLGVIFTGGAPHFLMILLNKKRKGLFSFLDILVGEIRRTRRKEDRSMDAGRTHHHPIHDGIELPRNSEILFIRKCDTTRIGVFTKNSLLEFSLKDP